jgi:hypothetical protein
VRARRRSSTTPNAGRWSDELSRAAEAPAALLERRANDAKAISVLARVAYESSSLPAPMAVQRRRVALRTRQLAGWASVERQVLPNYAEFLARARGVPLPRALRLTEASP